ncbi:hypothetical protein [Phycicoccus sp. Root101]|uniref:hypothetical protein n=1 Tax=Phycicoccus sp. Root101 TaxID=1736421 RepID=UPI0007031564|nr:hypothetical protein [Phycicoccus sp. Root101]KQU64139.1 hypothetical protein ASC58_19705 [Phycicoccus sp. Root101]
MNRTARLALPVAVLALALTACGNAPERAVTVGTQSPAAKAAQTSEAAPKPKGAGDKLNAKQVKAALLAVGDMPTGWAAAESEPEKDDTSTVEPASCQKLFDNMDTSGKKVKAKNKAKTSFTQGGMLGVQFEEEVASFDDDNQGDKVQGLAKVLTECSKMTVVDGADRMPMTMTGLSFPNLGDQTLAFRAKAKSDGIEVVIDAVFVAVGHNVVSFTAAGLTPMAGDDMEKVARAGMDKVATAAKS